MRRLLVAAALSAVLTPATPAHSSGSWIIHWTAKAPFVTTSQGTCDSIGFLNDGLAVGDPMSGTWVDEACLSQINEDGSTSWSGYWKIENRTQREALWGTFDLSGSLNPDAVLRASGSFTISGGGGPWFTCAAFVCPGGVFTGAGNMTMETVAPGYTTLEMWGHLDVS